LQISGANLLVAGQQTIRSAQQAPPPATSQNTADTEFAPIDFKPAPQRPAANASTVASSSPASNSGTPQRLQRPGSQLDITV
jgi:hypothetical protein